MPITTVTKITGPVTVLMSWMNASASHLALMAASGATRPKTIPAADRDEHPEPQLGDEASPGARALGRECGGGGHARLLPKLGGPPAVGRRVQVLGTPDRRRMRLIHAEPPPRHRDRVGARVDEHEPPPEGARHRAERPGAGEAVQAPPAGARRGGHHPLHDPDRLLRRIAG